MIYSLLLSFNGNTDGCLSSSFIIFFAAINTGYTVFIIIIIITTCSAVESRFFGPHCGAEIGLKQTGSWKYYL